MPMYPDSIDEAQRQAIDRHLQLVLEANQTTNITRIEDPDRAEVLHIEDSLVGLPECLAAPAGRYADLGSGAGYPGIPLAVATGRQAMLVESVKKKASLLSHFAEQLNLAARVSVYPGRAEELAAEQPEAFALVTARALTALPSLLELASPLLQHGGVLVAYKAGDVADELAWAEGIQQKLGLQKKSVRHTVLSDGCTDRSIIVFEKVAEPTVTLPRRPGMAQKRPYKAK
jgi:16S rRNA (guanine527-N7)-methyltransferase